MFVSKTILFLIAALYLLSFTLHANRAYLDKQETRYAFYSINLYNAKHPLEFSSLKQTIISKSPFYTAVESLLFSITTKPFLVRAVSFVFTIVIAFGIYSAAKNAAGKEAALFGAYGFLLSFITFFIYSQKATPHILYAAFMFFAFLSIFVYKDRGLCIGLFLLSFAFLIYGFLSITTFYAAVFLYGYKTGSLKKYLLSKYHFFGIILFLSIVGLWFFFISSSDIHKINYILGVFLLNPTLNHISHLTIPQFIKHILTAPLKIVYFAMPFFLIFAVFFEKHIRDEFRNIKQENSKIRELLNFIQSVIIAVTLVFFVLTYTTPADFIVLFAFISMLSGIVFYELEYVKPNINYLRISYYIFVGLSVLAFLSAFFGFEFINSKDYVLSFLLVFISAAAAFLLKKLEDDSNILFFVFGFSAVILKLLYVSVYINYTNSYQPNYKKYAHKISKFVLKNNPEYVMSEGGNLQLFFYFAKNIQMPIHSYSKNAKGIVVSRNMENAGSILDIVETPEGVYYIGIKNGGV